MFQRHGHLKDVFVKVGDKVKKGQKIGTVGNGNGQYINASHDHADFPVQKLASWTAYVFGWTKEEVKKIYADPKQFRSICAPWFDHLGWGYLEYATYGSKKCYHPGEDWNGKGSGDSDYGLPIYSAFDGEVVYLYNGTGTNGGWGKLLVIEEKTSPKIELQNTETPKDLNITKPVKPQETTISEEITLLENNIETSNDEKTPKTYQDFTNIKNQLQDVLDIIVYYLKKLINLIFK